MRPPRASIGTLFCLLLHSTTALRAPSLFTPATTATRARTPLLFGGDPLGDTPEEKADALVEETEVWRLREGMVRGLYGTIVNWKEDERDERQAALDEDRDPLEATRSAVIASAGVVVVGALVLRLGGRAALVSLLGLDFVSEMGIGDNVDAVVAAAETAGPLTVVGFVLAWCVAKVFLVDVLSIALAFSSGILFGGVFQGAFISAAGATVGSYAAFQLSRGALQERTEKALRDRPTARALAKVVEEDGFRTVFVLRLAPIIPMPLGLYSYVYGASNLTAFPFIAATFLGSIKPYLVDSYAGVFSKQILDGESMDSSRDLILLIGLGVLVLVGTFATDLAGEAFDKVQQEVKDEEKRRIAAGLDPITGLDPNEIVEKDPDEGMIGPFNTTEVKEWLDANAFVGLRGEIDNIWEQLLEFNRFQWDYAARAAVEGRRRREADEEKKMPGSDSDNPIERLLANLATPAEEETTAEAKAVGGDGDDGAKPSAADVFYGEDKATPPELAEREMRAAWTLEGGLARVSLTSLLFTFALAAAAKEQWDSYPDDEEQFAKALWALEDGELAALADGGEAAEDAVIGGGGTYP